MRVYHYYLDETGNLNNNQDLFIYGCIVTDTVNINNSEIEELKNSFELNHYLNRYYKKVEKGFHAVDDHPDVRAKLYELIALLNFEVYFEVLLKDCESYEKEFKKKMDSEIIILMLVNIINKLIRRDSKAKHVVNVEFVNLKGVSLLKVLNDVKNILTEKGFFVDFNIVKKENSDYNMVIIDYMNYIIKFLFERNNDKFENHTTPQDNFDLLWSKIGSIHIINNGLFLSRNGKGKKELNITNIRKVLSEVAGVI